MAGTFFSFYSYTNEICLPESKKISLKLKINYYKRSNNIHYEIVTKTKEIKV